MKDFAISAEQGQTQYRSKHMTNPEEQRVNKSGSTTIIPDELNLSVNAREFGAYATKDPDFLIELTEGISDALAGKFNVETKKPLLQSNCGTKEKPEFRAAWMRTVQDAKEGKPGFFKKNKYQEKETGEWVGKGDRFVMVLRVNKDQRQELDAKAIAAEVTANVLAALGASGTVDAATLAAAVANATGDAVNAANETTPVAAEPTEDQKMEEAIAAATAACEAVSG
jgi:hypothetical protein